MAIQATPTLEREVRVFNGDIDRPTFARLLSSPMLAWDIETTGLDWHTDRIGTIQVHDRGNVVVVRGLETQPQYLTRLLETPDTPKVFHHAMFDLRFMAATWGALASNVSCTKIAAKLLRLPPIEQSLAPLLHRYLGVKLDKTEQTSDWVGRRLSDAQLAYAAADVLHLETLIGCLRGDLEARGMWSLATACFDHLPARVALEIHEFPDVFVY